MPIDKLQPSLPLPAPPTQRGAREKNRAGKDSYVNAAPTDPRRLFLQMLSGSAGDVASPWTPLPRPQFDAIEPAHDWDFPKEENKIFESIQSLNDFLEDSRIVVRLDQKPLGQLIVETKGINTGQAVSIVNAVKKEKIYPVLDTPKIPPDLSAVAELFSRQHDSAHQEIKFYERLFYLKSQSFQASAGAKHPITIGEQAQQIFKDRIEEVRKSVYENYLMIAKALEKMDPSANSEEKLLKETRDKMKPWFAPAAAPKKIKVGEIEFPEDMYNESERTQISQYRKFFITGVLSELSHQRSELKTKWDSSPQWGAFEEGLKKKAHEILTHIDEMKNKIEAGKEKFVPDRKVLEQTPEQFAVEFCERLVQETRLAEPPPPPETPPPTIEELQKQLAEARKKLGEAQKRTSGEDAEKITLRLDIRRLETDIARHTGEPPPEVAATPATETPPSAAMQTAAPEPVATPAEPLRVEPAVLRLPPPPEEIPPIVPDLPPEPVAEPGEPATPEKSPPAETDVWASIGLSGVYLRETETRYIPFSPPAGERPIFEEYRNDYEETVRAVPPTKSEESISHGLVRANVSLSPFVLLGVEELAFFKLLAEAEMGTNFEVEVRAGVGLSLEPWLDPSFINDLSVRLLLRRWGGEEDTNLWNLGSEILQPGVCAAAGIFQTCFDWTSPEKTWIFSVGIRKTFSD